METLKSEKLVHAKRLQAMHHILRNHEHAICKKMFPIKDLIRECKLKVNSYAFEKEQMKREIDQTRKRILFKGVCQYRLHNGPFVKIWRYSHIVLTGEYLVVAEASPNSTYFDPSGYTSDSKAISGAHRIRVSDIVHVDTTSSGFDTQSPVVQFTIFTRKQTSSSSAAVAPAHRPSDAEFRATDDAESIVSSMDTINSSAAAATVKKSKKMTISIAAISDLTAKGPRNAFPLSASDLSLSFFDRAESADRRFAHCFVFGLKASSHLITFDGDYIPLGWVKPPKLNRASSVWSSGSSESGLLRSQGIYGASEADGPNLERRSSFGGFWSKLTSSFSRNSECVSASTAGSSGLAEDPNGSERGHQSTQSASDVRVMSSPLGKKNSDFPNRASESNVSSRPAAAVKRQSSGGSDERNSALTSSSLGRTTGLSFSDSSGRESSYSYSGYRSSAGAGEGLLNEESPTYINAGRSHLETVAEREERQISSDSDGQLSCKLAAQLAGIVSVAVFDSDTFSGSVGLRRRTSSSFLSNPDGGSGGRSGPSSPPLVAWESSLPISGPSSAIKRSSDGMDNSPPPVLAEYEELDGLNAPDAPVDNFDDLRDGPMIDVQSQSMRISYDVEALEGPTMTKSKSLPFKLPSNGNLAPPDHSILLRNDDIMTSDSSHHIAHESAEDYEDWKSVGSDQEDSGLQESSARDRPPAHPLSSPMGTPLKSDPLKNTGANFGPSANGSSRSAPPLSIPASQKQPAMSDRERTTGKDVRSPGSMLVRATPSTPVGGDSAVDILREAVAKGSGTDLNRLSEEEQEVVEDLQNASGYAGRARLTDTGVSRTLFSEEHDARDHGVDEQVTQTKVAERTSFSGEVSPRKYQSSSVSRKQVRSSGLNTTVKSPEVTNRHSIGVITKADTGGSSRRKDFQTKMKTLSDLEEALDQLRINSALVESK